MAANISQTVLEAHKAGKIRILAAASDRRLVAAPEISTGAEAGFPDLIAQLFMGLFAPFRTPAAIIEKIAATTHDVLSDRGVQESLISAGFEPVTASNPEGATKFIQEEMVRWAPVLKSAGMKAS